MWFFHFGNFYPMVPAAENCLHHQLRNFTPHFKTQCSYHSSIIPIHCTTWFEMDRQAGISQLSEPSTRDGRKNTKKQRVMADISSVLIDCKDMGSKTYPALFWGVKKTDVVFMWLPCGFHVVFAASQRFIPRFSVG